MHGRLSRWLSLRKLGLYSSGMPVRLCSYRFNQFICSVVLKTSTTSTHAKMFFQSSSENALKVVVLYLPVSSNVPMIMKLLLKTVHAWKAVQEDVHVQTGTVMQLFQVRLVENYNSKLTGTQSKSGLDLV